MELPIVRDAIRDADVVSSRAQNSLALFEHKGDVDVGEVAAEEGVDGGLVYNEVEGVVGIGKVATVHHIPLHLLPGLLVALPHLLDAD
eukprot:CAMPEP_0168617938 /NCGR_PEP_ID=MMETSP0449_2-20121227/5806_1 /TAXON_ID=1082188 /ORGANISM="Strombidium rassoulzadegani, Strain ras09" /LENGTH=87 /DNA_ID=CAMNT_0008658781 /DNA_START=438 /DNA_END=701 /DNA_ORIENTATION=+